MIVSWEQLTGFFVVSLVMIVIPGPGVLFVVGRALSHGRQTAMVTAAGHAVGNYVVVVLIAVGVGAVLARSEEIFTVVKLAGAAYLVWLGVQAFRHRGSLAEAMSAASSGETREGWRALRDGIAVGITNPKTFILFGALLPQFVDRSAGSATEQMLLLGLMSACLGVASDCTWGLAASGVRAWFAKSPRRFAMVGGAGGLAMIAVGASVALTGRKN